MRHNLGVSLCEERRGVGSQYMLRSPDNATPWETSRFHQLT